MAMTHYPQATKRTEIPSMGVNNCNAFLTDLVVSEDPDKTIVGDFSNRKSDEPLVYTYTLS